MKKPRIKILVVSVIIFLTYITVIIVRDVQFDIGCTDRIKRAADANTIDLAIQEMEAVVSYLVSNNLTEGYTSVLFKTPDEDVGFWFTNLKHSLDELKKVRTDASQLEKTNVLMKLRETLLDESSYGIKVTLPKGISRFPKNTFFFIVGLISIAGLIFGIFYFFEEFKRVL